MVVRSADVHTHEEGRVRENRVHVHKTHVPNHNIRRNAASKSVCAHGEEKHGKRNRRERKTGKDRMKQRIDYCRVGNKSGAWIERLTKR